MNQPRVLGEIVPFGTSNRMKSHVEFIETKDLGEFGMNNRHLASSIDLRILNPLHDADWDQWPEQHCKKIIEELESRNVDPEILHAIASHGPLHFGVEPETKMDKMLYAFDELSGLIHAYSLMRPGGYEGMDVKGVKKRLKEKSFAANVSREDISDACNRAGIPLDELIAFIIPRQAEVV